MNNFISNSLITLVIISMSFIAACNDDDYTSLDGDSSENETTDGDVAENDLSDGDMDNTENNEGDIVDGDSESEMEPEKETLAFSVVIEPENPQTKDDLSVVITLEDENLSLDDFTVTYNWQRDNQTVEITDSQIMASETSKGENWSVTVIVNGTSITQSEETAETEILNTLPAITSVEVNSENSSELGEVTCDVEGASDDDGDSIGFVFSWSINDSILENQADQSLSGDSFNKGDTVSCSATPVDDEGAGTTVEADNFITILDTPPSITSATITPGVLYACSLPACEYEWTDPDPADTEFSLIVNFEWKHNESVISSAESEFFTQQSLSYGDTLSCTVLYKVSEEDEWLKEESAETGIGNVAPMIETTQITPAVAFPGDQLTCTAQGYIDPDCSKTGRFAYKWYVDDELVESAFSSVFSTDTLIGGQTVSCEITPNDGNENGTPVSSLPLFLEPDGFEIIGELPHSMAGFSVAIIDDINGDGYSELLIGAPNATPEEGRDRSGQVYVIYGKPSDEDIDLQDIVAGNGGFVFEGENGGLDLEVYLCRDYSGYFPCGEARDIDYTSTAMATLDGPNGDGFGFTVSALGDMDADGIGDVMITAPFAYIEPRMFRGKAYAISGAKLATTSIAGIVSNASTDGYVSVGEFGSRLEETTAQTGSFAPFNGDLLGWAGDSVGDVNGDGLADWAATSTNYGNEEQGKVYVFYGRDDGQTVDPTFAVDKEGVDGFWIHGRSKTGSYPRKDGMILKGIGDFDGDGYDDILVHGAMLAAFDAFIIYGSEKGINIDLNNPDAGLEQGEKSRVSKFTNGEWQAQSVGIEIVTVGGRLIAQWECGGGGDVNGDGLSDVIFTSEAADTPNEALVVFGREERGTTDLDDIEQGIGGFFISGEFSTFAPWGEVLIGGDFNADGLDDIVISSYSDKVQVIYGKADSDPISTDDVMSGIGGFTIMKPFGTGGYGMDADVGDINGDGLADLLIGSTYTNNERGSEVGGAFVRFGRDSEGLADFRGGDANDYFVGTTEAEIFISGRGDDILDGNGGADVLYAGAGDDIIKVTDLDFLSIRAGRGFDTLVLEEDGLTFDLHELRGRVRDIEAIDLTGNGAQTLNIERLDLLRLSSSSNELLVTGDDSDSVGSFASRWFFEGIDERDGHEFYRLSYGHAVLLIETNVQTFIAPAILTESMELAENSPNDTLVGTIETTDPDGTISSFTLLDEHGYPDVFTLDPVTGDITVADSQQLDFESVAYFDLTIEVTDDSGLSQSNKIRISLTDQSEPPIFTIQPPEYFTEENANNGTVLGLVSAIDPDEGDFVSYRLTGEASAPFNIGTYNGIINVMDNSLLDYETSTQHVFKVEAYDQNDMSTEIEVIVNIGDADVIETSGRMTFVITEQSMWENGQPIEVSWPAGTTPMEWPEDPDAIPIPFPLTDVTFDWHGRVEVINEIDVKRGWYSAIVPMDVTIQIPDEIVPGENMSITRWYTLDRKNGRFWGESPGFDLNFGLKELDDVGFTLEACFNDNCDPPISQTWDYTGPITMLDYEVEPKGFSGHFDPDDTSSFMYMDKDVEFEVYDFEVDWDSYFQQTLQYLGLPTNEGSYPVNDQLGNPFFAIDYLVYTFDLTHNMTYKQSSRLGVATVYARITYEEVDKTEQIIVPNWQNVTNVPVPADADANNDGRIEISIRFLLDSAFKSNITLTGSYGEKLKVGELTVRSLKPQDSYAWFPPITKGPVIETSGSVNMNDSFYAETWNHGDLSNQPVWRGFLDVAN